MWAEIFINGADQAMIHSDVIKLRLCARNELPFTSNDKLISMDEFIVRL